MIHHLLRSFLLIICLTHSAAAQFIHPGITSTKSDLDRMKFMVESKIDPWFTSYNEMAADSKASFDYTVRGDQSFTEVGRDNGVNYNAWNDDIRAAYYNAIQWYVTGDVRHANKAVEIFNAWNNIQDVTSNGTQALSGGIAYIMIEAAEIIKSTYDGWEEGDIQKFKDMLVYPGYSNTAVPSGISRTSGSFYWQAYQGDSIRHGNQGLAGFRTVMAMGIFLDNEIMYDRALRYIQGLPHRADDLAYPSGPHTATTISNVGDYEDTYNFTISDSIPDFGFNEVMTNYIYENGQCQESSRDQQHTVFGIGNICSMAEMAWNQGDDLYSHANDRLLLGLEYTAKYNVSFLQSYPDQPQHWIPTEESGEFTQRFDATQRFFAKTISPVSVGGYLEVRPVYELPVAHYIGRGFKTANEALWTTRARDVFIADSGYEQAGHKNDAVGWGSLSERRPAYCYGDPISGFSNGLPVFEIPTLPATIEAEHYDYSPVDGEGRTYHDSTQANQGGSYRTADRVDISQASEGGYKVSDITDGEWLSYTVYAESTGDYSLSVRYTAAEDVAIRFQFDGTDITETVTLPATGGESSWSSFTVASNVELSQGVQSMRVYFSNTSDTFGLNSITIASKYVYNQRIQAEGYDEQSGVRTEDTDDIDGVENLGYIEDGDWSSYDNITMDGVTKFRARIARPANRPDSEIEIRLDSISGTLIGSVEVISTGGWQQWETVETDLIATTGNHNLYLVYVENGTSTGSSLFNFNWFELESPDGQITEYAKWAENDFPTTGTGTDDYSPTGNPDGDRFDNELEWAMDSDPMVANNSPFDLTTNGDEVTITYRRRNPTVTNIDIFPSWSTTLSDQSWRPDGDGITESSNGWTDDVESLSVVIPQGHDKAFIRIEAVKR